MIRSQHHPSERETLYRKLKQRHKRKQASASNVASQVTEQMSVRSDGQQQSWQHPTQINDLQTTFSLPHYLLQMMIPRADRRTTSSNTNAWDVVAELSLWTEPYRAQGNMWDNVVDLSESVILIIAMYDSDSDSQPYHYKSRFLIGQNTAPVPFTLGLPFLIHMSPNHSYNTGSFQWRKNKH